MGDPPLSAWQSGQSQTHRRGLLLTSDQGGQTVSTGSPDPVLLRFTWNACSDRGTEGTFRLPAPAPTVPCPGCTGCPAALGDYGVPPVGAAQPWAPWGPAGLAPWQGLREQGSRAETPQGPWEGLPPELSSNPPTVPPTPSVAVQPDAGPDGPEEPRGEDGRP